MQIKMREPITARNIYINPNTNTVHLLMPIVGGTEVATDNTCLSATALKTFFGKYANAKENASSALNILQNYKAALLEDIMLLPDNNPQKSLKRARLEQISAYIDVMKKVKDDRQLDSLYGLDNSNYPEPIKRIIKSGGNLFGMILRPADGYDSHLNSVNHVFKVNRDNNTVFFDALVAEFDTLNILPKQSIYDMFRQKFGAINVRNENEFRDFQLKLGELLGADFLITNEGVEVTKRYINQQMGDDDMTVEGYIEALINFCTKNLLQTLESSPFKLITNNDNYKLCFLTQFYLGEVNIFCKANGLSNKNFGEVFDNNPELANTLAKEVKSAVENNASAETVIIRIINENLGDFNLSEQLTVNQVADINSRVYKHFTTVEGMENADEFMLTYPDINGKFVTHQGSICTDFAELVAEGFPNQMSSTCRSALNDFQQLDYYVDNNNARIDYQLNLDLRQAKQYLTNLITNNHPELAIKVLSENYEQIKGMPQSALASVFNATTRSSVTLLSYCAKNSPEEFAKIASLLSKQNLLTCMSAKNRLSDTVLHSILNKPQILQLVVAALPGDTLAALLQIKNSRGETVMSAATNAASKQILQDGLNNPNDLIAEVPAEVEIDEHVLISESTPNDSTNIQITPNQNNIIDSESLTPNDTDSEDTESTVGSERSISPVVQSGLSFFKPIRTPRNNKDSHQLYLNSTPDEVTAGGSRNCFVWQTSKRRELVYISIDGEQSTAQMPINKAFTFQAELQKVAKSSGESQESNCVLQVTTSAMQGLLEKAGINSPVFTEALVSSSNNDDTDSETASDGSVSP